MLDRLKYFKKLHGHCTVPRKYSRDPQVRSDVDSVGVEWGESGRGDARGMAVGDSLLSLEEARSRAISFLFVSQYFSLPPSTPPQLANWVKEQR